MIARRSHSHPPQWPVALPVFHCSFYFAASDDVAIPAVGAIPAAAAVVVLSFASISLRFHCAPLLCCPSGSLRAFQHRCYCCWSVAPLARSSFPLPAGAHIHRSRCRTGASYSPNAIYLPEAHRAPITHKSPIDESLKHFGKGLNLFILSSASSPAPP